MMTSAHTERNWQLIVAGILLALFGLVCLFFPGLTLASIVFMVGAAFVLSGIVNFVTYLRDRDMFKLSGWMLAYGIIDILIGLMFLIHPAIFAAVVSWLAGLFVIVFALSEITGALAARKGGFPLWGWLLFSGIVSLLIGVLFFVVPELLAYYVGAFALMRGASLIVLGANSRRFV